MSNIYYNPEEFGLQTFGSLDEDCSYEFNMLVVWLQPVTGKLFWATDSGCSCPSPFETENLQSLNPLVRETLTEFENRVKEFPDTLASKEELTKKVRTHLEVTPIFDTPTSVEGWASFLNGRNYGQELSKNEEAALKEQGFVVVFGYSDDNVEFRGAINEEMGCFGGGEFYLNQGGLMEPCHDECKYYEAAKTKGVILEAFWNKDGYSWAYSIPVATASFDIMEDGEKFCKAIIFPLNSLPQ